MARSLCIVGGTEWQCHSFMDNTHVGVFQVSLNDKLVTCHCIPGFEVTYDEDTILCTLLD